MTANGSPCQNVSCGHARHDHWPRGTCIRGLRAVKGKAAPASVCPCLVYVPRPPVAP